MKKIVFLDRGTSEFGSMSKRPLLINTARGGLVDEDALSVAPETGQISGAGFDVVTQEPLPESHQTITRCVSSSNSLMSSLFDGAHPVPLLIGQCASCLDDRGIDGRCIRC
jgi:hypothetical protein